ncbi:hypothetical protein FOXG_19959 [Fusarium oxysporum f. sp. lycopersici 4287]|uniref:Uncharacterized protein n=2 Tax=Fusarium oxysporum TaxID=5507 RepID=A0A0J9VA01_FUSO4|nr:hypothetical protein FOXG_19959 [Fusarium oxysporum f. sp. lycopersici 4287]EXK36874.1 hypothetical protein FOMG_07766 [Fusarium oxysporum f. sp. melonis 26406]KNB07960.1 hypothetical protein FOXG_19959 [Fusarium oxysporum f. sp. lycopersici 4287]
MIDHINTAEIKAQWSMPPDELHPEPKTYTVFEPFSQDRSQRLLPKPAPDQHDEASSKHALLRYLRGQRLVFPEHDPDHVSREPRLRLYH